MWRYQSEDEMVNSFMAEAIVSPSAHLHIDVVYKFDKRGKGWVSKGIRLYESAIRLKKNFSCNYKVGLIIPLADTKRNIPPKVNHLNALKLHLCTPPEIGLYRMDEEETQVHFRKMTNMVFQKQPVYRTFKLFSRYDEDDKIFSHWLYLIEDFN